MVVTKVLVKLSPPIGQERSHIDGYLRIVYCYGGVVLCCNQLALNPLDAATHAQRFEPVVVILDDIFRLTLLILHRC